MNICQSPDLIYGENINFLGLFIKSFYITPLISIIIQREFQLARTCLDCHQPARYKVQTYDGQTLYLCEKHVKDWIVPKIKKLK